MLDALLVLVEDDDIGDGLFLTLIVTDDELQFDTHRRASPGSSGRRRVHAILPDFCGFPQHPPALDDKGQSTMNLCRPETSRAGGYSSCKYCCAPCRTWS